jgi:hypothetical protein
MDTPQQPECNHEGDGRCIGPVEYHIPPDRDDFKAFPMCAYHWTKRLNSAERTRELLSDVPPDWFDPAYAGERWDDEY